MPGVVNKVAGGPGLCTVSQVDTSLVVSSGFDCGRRRRSVYDKKPQRYAKDNRTAHLTARSDKSVAYVTNNKCVSRTDTNPPFAFSGVARNLSWGVYVLTSHCNFKTCVNVPHMNKTVTDFGGIYTDIPPVATPLGAL